MSKIAIIGFRGRFPGNARSPLEFFGQLLAADCFCGDVPADRWSKDRFCTRDQAAGKTPTSRGFFIDYDYRGFDSDVFSLPPDEIARLDPQQRLVLEVAWEALEHAAIDPAALSAQAVGVYVGGFTTDHLLNQFSPQARSGLGRFSAVGSTLTMLANRLSYVLDLRGPSVTVDTACASGLTALDAAVRDLQTGACDMALVGGVSFMLRPEYQIGMSAAGLLAVDGRSKPFSHRADGYGRGEGCGVLVLKRLADACAAHDPVRAVVEAIGTGHGGRTAGISLPNGAAQEDLMRRVLAASGLTPDDIGYLEAHGTGTAQGDRIEAHAIGAVYGRTARQAALPIGSVKANIGHLEAAAGIAGVIKALLILQEGRIPPHLLVGHPNPEIPFDALGLRLPRTPEPLKGSRVAVSAFGYGGSTAHVILGPPPVAPVSAVSAVSPDPAHRSGSVMVPVSAHSTEALSDWLEALADEAAAGRLPLGDLCYTLGRRRGHRPVRRAVWVDRAAPPATLATIIRQARTGGAITGTGTESGTRAGDRSRILFVFSGMGAHRPGMGQSLWASDPVFREAVEELDALFRPLSGVSLVEAITAPDPSPRCRTLQPVQFAIQVGLVRVLSAHGLTPDLCLGHSAGEVAAALCSGHLTPEQAVAVCWARSDLQDQQTGTGGMTAAAVDRDAAQQLCDNLPGLEIAAVNARRSITFAGPDRVLLQAEHRLDERKIPFRRLPVDIAYHSAAMDPILPRLEARLADLRPVPPALPLLSSVTAQGLSGLGPDRMDAAYWRANVRQPVHFHAALETAFAMGVTQCLEIGPKPVLTGLIRKQAQEQARDIATVPVLHGQGDGQGDGQNEEQDEEQSAVRTALTRVYVNGGALDWQRAAPDGTLCPLPATVWRRKQIWHETDVQAQDRLGHPGANPWAEPSVSPHCWIADLNRQAFAFLGDHRIEGQSILPGTAALEAAVQTAQAARGLSGPADLPIGLADIRFEATLPLNRRVGQVLDSRALRGAVETLAYPPTTPSSVIRVLSARITDADVPAPAVRPIPTLAALAPCPLDPEQHQARLAALGIDHGTSFRVVKALSLATDGRAVLAQLAVGQPVLQDGPTQWPPCLLDGIFQAAMALTTDCVPLVPTAIGAYTLYAPLPQHLWAWVTLDPTETPGRCFTATLYDGGGQCLAHLQKMTVSPLTPEPEGGAPPPDLCLTLDWREAPPDAPPDALSGNRQQASPRRVALIAPAPHRQPLYRALTAAGLEVSGADGDAGSPAEAVDATVMIVPEGPHCLADQLGDLLDLCTAPANGRVYLLTENAVATSPQDAPVRPEQAAVWGLGRTVFNEIAETATTLMDVTPDASWHDAVAAEIAANRPGSESAFRNGRRLLPRLCPVSLADTPPPQFNRSGSYLITGGLGGFGRQLALWLARQGAGTLVLTSRSHPTAAALAPLHRDLSALGADLIVVPLDLTDDTAVRTLLLHLAGGQTPLAGLFHWAGSTLDRPATALTAETIRPVLDPKAGGALALHRASLDLPLDHFVLASSLSALVGTPRQANYAAANAALDGLAWSRHRAGLPALSLNFGPISGAGMAAEPQVAAHLRAAGLPPMPMAMALAGLGAALSLSLRVPQISLSRAIDTDRWSQYDPRGAGTDRMAGLLDGVRGSVGRRHAVRKDLARHPPGKQARMLAEHLRTLLADCLACGPEQLSRDVPLGRLGLDSIGAIAFQRQIDGDLGIAVPITALIGGQTLAGLAESLVANLVANRAPPVTEDSPQPLAKAAPHL